MSSPAHGQFLTGILNSVRAEVAAAKRAAPLSELEKRVHEAPPVRSFSAALSDKFAIIAEIKERSPSAGKMNPEDVLLAPKAYEACALVGAISVLTNQSHFGMNVRKLSEIRGKTSKPILRKDFILDEYQVVEARVWGADAILLMANVLSRERLRELGQLACDLGMEILFESHTAAEIERIPRAIAKCWGINCRKLDSSNEIARYRVSTIARKITRALRLPIARRLDLSIEDKALRLVEKLPPGAVKVAESGITPEKIRSVRDMGYNSALIGNCLLTSPRGVESELRAFSEALGTAHRGQPAAKLSPIPTTPIAHPG